MEMMWSSHLSSGIVCYKPPRLSGQVAGGGSIHFTLVLIEKMAFVALTCQILSSFLEVIEFVNQDSNELISFVVVKVVIFGKNTKHLTYQVLTRVPYFAAPGRLHQQLWSQVSP